MKFDQPTLLWRGIEVSLLKQNWGKYFKGKILDLGCGDGEIARQVFLNKGETFVKAEWGLDNDKEMVRKAKKSGVYKQVIWGEAAKIELKDGIVDLVFSNSVLEHIKDVEKVLPEVERVLRRGGRLIATMPTDKLGEYLGWGSGYAKWFNRKYHHYHLYSKEKWEGLLLRAGMELVDSYYYLDRPIIKQWHELLWLNKLGIKGKPIRLRSGSAKFLARGAALAILGRKI